MSDYAAVWLRQKNPNLAIQSIIPNISANTQTWFSLKFSSDPAASLKPRKPIPRNFNDANNCLEYIGEYEAVCKTAFAGKSEE
jgi:hypothetical protein